jgi:nitrite reductase (NADH) large subunit
MCGSDPARILEGEENLSAMRSAERRTLERLSIRRSRCRTAAIVAGGLLGLEAAYYLAQLDLRVLVLDRGPWPLSRQLDEQARALVREML